MFRADNEWVRRHARPFREGPIGLFLLSVVTKSAIEISPNTLRCDGSLRSIIFRIPSDVATITLEARESSIDGAVIQSDSQSKTELEAYRLDATTFRIETTTSDAWECRQEPGRYAFVLRDADSGRILGTTEFSIDD